MKLSEIKLTKRGALLKNGFYLERDPEQIDGLRTWGIKRMLVPDELGEAAIMDKSIGEGYIFKITSYRGGGSATQGIGSVTDSEEQLLQRFFEWVETFVDDPEMGWENETE